MPTVTVGTENNAEIALYFQDVGAGQPVVLIHGWPLSGRAWEAQVPALVDAGYRVISYDRRGFGASSQPYHGYDYDTFAADLHALITALDLDDAVLVGFSMGGGELARYVARYGTDRVSRLVFASAVPPALFISADNPDGGLDEATIDAFRDGVRNTRIAFIDQFLTNFFSVNGTDLVDPHTHGYYARIAELASPKATLDCITAFATTDFRDDLAKIDVPTLVIHGSADAIVPVEVSGSRTHASISGSQLVVLDGAPHGAPVTHAAEWNAAVLEFLTS
jgi:pimeloyl-ACP methyl ester carboxylesterase